LIGHILDVHLSKIAHRTGCHYTRYADDLTFSTNKPDFPAKVAINNAHQWLPAPHLERLIAKCGFTINPKKTRMQYCDSRQEVTGLLVNRRVNVKQEYRRNVRAMVHRLLTTGHFQVRGMVMRDDQPIIEMVDGKDTQLHGMLGFIEDVDY